MLIYLKLFGRRISKDFRHKELLPLKLLFFIHASTLFVLYPYLTIHMRELGINVEETAIMSAVIPVVAIIMPPMAGMLADKIGNFKLLLALFSTLGGLSALLLLAVPIGRITITYPNEVVVGLSCNSKRLGTHMSLSVYQEHVCDPAHTYKYNTDLTIQSCGFVCQAFVNDNSSDDILNTPSYSIEMHDLLNNASKTFIYETPKLNKTITDSTKYEMTNHKVLKNDERYKTVIRKLSKHSYFFPSTGLFNFSCELKDNYTDAVQYNTTLNETTFEIPGDQKYYVCRFGTQKDVQDLNAFRKNFSVTVQLQSNTSDDILENRSIFDIQSVSEFLNDENQYHPSICYPGYGQVDQHISVSVPIISENVDEKNRILNLGSCAPRCIATAPRNKMCSNTKSLIELDMTVTFWSYLVVRVFIAMIGGTAFAMFEGAVIAILRDRKADYGLQRIYASIGGMISSPVSGWLIDYFSKGKSYTDFRPAFYLYAVLKVMSGVLMLAINLDFKTPARNVVSDVITVLKKVELIALFISCFILGTAWGYIESFLFWLLQDLGGTRSLMGFTITVGGIAGIPLLVLSGPIIKRIGHANVIFIGFIFYGIRLLGYSLIYNPWHCLIFEAMESITSSLSFTAAVTYAAKLSSLTTDTSVQGMLGGLYYGVGKGAGSLIGGFLMEVVGTRPTYQIFAAMTVVTGIAYFCFNHFYIRKRVQDEKETPDDDKNEDIPKVPVDLPAGFVDVELIPSWSPEEVEDDIEKKQTDNNKNGHINVAFDDNENEKKINTSNNENDNEDDHCKNLDNKATVDSKNISNKT